MTAIDKHVSPELDRPVINLPSDGTVDPTKGQSRDLARLQMDEKSQQQVGGGIFIPEDTHCCLHLFGQGQGDGHYPAARSRLLIRRTGHHANNALEMNDKVWFSVPLTSRAVLI